jgi:hypothetical protein
MANLVSMGNIKTSPETRQKIRAHVIMRGEKLGEWLEKAVIAMYENETMSAPSGKGDKNETQQKNEHESHNV